MADKVSRVHYENAKKDMTRIAGDPRNNPDTRKTAAEAIVKEVHPKLGENN